MRKLYSRLLDLKNLAAINPEKLRPSTKLSPHFTMREIICKDSNRNFVDNLPPYRYFGNFLETLFFLETLRLYINRPVKLNSVYRSRSYNKRIGGASRSCHVTFHAADVRNPYLEFSNTDARHQYDKFYDECDIVANHLESVHGCNIRLGRYSKQHFVHVDCDRSKYSKRWEK